MFARILFIFLITLLLEVVMDAVGEDVIASFMAGNPWLSVVAASRWSA